MSEQFQKDIQDAGGLDKLMDKLGAELGEEEGGKAGSGGAGSMSAAVQELMRGASNTDGGSTRLAISEVDEDTELGSEKEATKYSFEPASRAGANVCAAGSNGKCAQTGQPLIEELDELD